MQKIKPEILKYSRFDDGSHNTDILIDIDNNNLQLEKVVKISKTYKQKINNDTPSITKYRIFHKFTDKETNYILDVQTYTRPD